MELSGSITPSVSSHRYCGDKVRVSDYPEVLGASPWQRRTREMAPREVALRPFRSGRGELYHNGEVIYRIGRNVPSHVWCS